MEQVSTAPLEVTSAKANGKKVAEHVGWGLLMVGDSPSNASGLHTLCVRSHVACGNSISSAKDIAFGKAAGVSTALVDADRRHFEEQTGADFVVQSLVELPRILWQHFDVNPSAEGPRRRPPIPISAACRAASSGDVPTLQHMELKDLEASDEFGNTPLIWAAESGSVAVVEMLLAAGVDANAKGYAGNSAISRASRHGHEPILRSLLAAKVGIKLDDPNDKLHMDFGLLELDAPVPFDDCVGSVCLPTKDFPTVGTNCEVTGWGTLNMEGAVPNVLQQGLVNTVSQDICAEQYAKDNQTITSGMLCATGATGQGVTDACQGDSGGPLVCLEGERFVIAGATLLKIVNFHGHMWAVVSGRCSIDEDGCVRSPGYPDQYGGREKCRIAVDTSAAMPITVDHFATEAPYDHLEVNCVPYSGKKGPHGIIPNSDIFWLADGSMQDSCWRLCPEQP
eukprot:g9156.t1